MSASSDSQRPPSQSYGAASMEKIVSLCKRRGFIFQSSEIYGGLNGLWDYGPLGVELKRNLKNYWWRVMVHERDDVVGMDGSILMNRAVWKASGHEDTFSDPMVDWRSCKVRLRADQLVEKKDVKQCPVCGGRDLTEPRPFNLMFKTYVGATEDESSLTYLRPETAQAIFVQFKNVLEISRKKLPFGIAQIGKAFRNEINPRNFTFRSREFEQMELEYFCRTEQGIELLEYWKEERLKFYENIGVPREKLHVKTVSDEERAFYSKGTYDIEYQGAAGREGKRDCRSFATTHERLLRRERRHRAALSAPGRNRNAVRRHGGFRNAGRERSWPARHSHIARPRLNETGTRQNLRAATAALGANRVTKASCPIRHRQFSRRR